MTREGMLRGKQMKKECVATKAAPAALGPYSQGVRAQGELLFVSGQIPFDAQTSELVSEDVQEQTRQCLLNLQAILEAGGATLSQVVKTTVYIKNMDDFGSINEIYATFFAEHPPARVCVEVARLPKDVLVEIDAIAVV